MSGQPLRQAWTRQEMATAAKAWLIDHYGSIPRDMESQERARWERDLGLLYAFLCDHFPEEGKE